jgi:hypothetical protein
LRNKPGQLPRWRRWSGRLAHEKASARFGALALAELAQTLIHFVGGKIRER